MRGLWMFRHPPTFRPPSPPRRLSSPLLPSSSQHSPIHLHTPPLRPPADPPPSAVSSISLHPSPVAAPRVPIFLQRHPCLCSCPPRPLVWWGLLSCRRTWCVGYLSCSCLRRFDRFPPTNHTLTAPPCIPRTRTASLSPPPTSRVGFPRAPSFSRAPLCFASAALCLVERAVSPRIAANSPRARRSPSPPMSSPRFTCAPFAYARTPRAHSPPARSRVSP